MSKPIPLGIEIGLPEALKPAFDGAGEQLRSYLASLVASLELPLETRLEPPRGSSTPDQIELTLGTRTIALPALDAPTPSALAEAMTRAVFRGRLLLVTDEVVEVIRQRWFPGQDDAPTLDALADLLRRAVRHGLRAGRLRDDAVGAGAWSVDDGTATRIIETQLDGADNLVQTRVGAAQHAAIDAPELVKMFSLMNDGLFWELGLSYRLGPVTLDPALDAGSFQFGWHDISSPPVQGLAPGELLVNDAPDRLMLLGVEARPATNPTNGAELAIVMGEAARLACEQAGLTTWGPIEYIVLQLSSELRRNAGAFISTGLVELYLIRLSRAFPALIAEVRRRFSSILLTGVLRALLEEELGIRDLRAVLESLLSVRGTTSVDFGRFIVFTPTSTALYPSRESRGLDRLGSEEYAECARMALKRYISHKYTRGANTLAVYLLAPAIEEWVGDSERERDILAAIRDELGDVPPTAQPVVILTSVGVRRPLARLLRNVHPSLAVLSYQELSPDMNIQPIARINPPEKPAPSRERPVLAAAGSVES